MIQLGTASAVLEVFAGEYAILSPSSYRPIEAERRRLSNRSAGWGCGKRVSARRTPCKAQHDDPHCGRSHHCAPWLRKREFLAGNDSDRSAN